MAEGEKAGNPGNQSCSHRRDQGDHQRGSEGCRSTSAGWLELGGGGASREGCSQPCVQSTAEKQAAGKYLPLDSIFIKV